MASKNSKPMRSKAMLSKCWDCTCGYTDGKVDCELPSCALYPWMPYRKLEPDLSWMAINPRRKGSAGTEEEPDPE